MWTYATITDSEDNTESFFTVAPCSADEMTAKVRTYLRERESAIAEVELTDDDMEDGFIFDSMVISVNSGNVPPQGYVYLR